MGSPIKFEVRAHGNRKTENLAHVRTKQSTKERAKENLKKQGSTRALFQTVKQAGGVCGAESPSSLPRNTRQAAHLKKKEERSSMHPTDPLAAVLELQKSTFRGFIRDVTCNDLPTVMLFTDRQVDNLVKFCCLMKPGLVSELGVDLTFQLSPFYVLVTTFRNTMLEAKRSSRSPAFPGPLMICMTKEEGTYLSFAHRLLREVPGLSKFLYATGTDDETALRNALAASFQAAHPLLCYLHSERNVKEKARQLGLSSQFTSRICKDVYSKSGLIWLNSKEEFQIQLQRILREWDTTEAAERVGPPTFSNYFSRNKVSLFDFVESFDFEEEMAWFGMSEKWQVKQEYCRYMPAKPYAEMSSEERTKEVKRIRNLRPDGKAYKECRDFKFAISCKPSTSGNTCPVVSKATSYSDEYVQSILTPHFSRKEASSMVQKANVIIHNKGIREGFSSGTFLVDSGTKLPYRVSCLKSGKVSCPAFGRNNLCRHSLAVALQQMCVDKMMSQFSGRSLTRLSTSTAPKNVGAKGASRKRGA